MDRETREGYQNSDSPLPDLPDEAPLSSVHEGSVQGEVDGDLYELHQQVVASEEHIANLEGELKGAADQEAETAQILDSERKRKAALDQQLHQAREEAARLILDEASQTRGAVRAEAEELLEASRVEAEREAGQVTKRAFDKANEMIAMARREAVAIVDAGREQVRALEDDAAQRMAHVDTEHRKLTHRLAVMETICDELVATLKLVAEISIEQLVETRYSVKQLDRLETQAALATTPVGEESILEAALREADHLTQDGQPETERMMAQSQANVTSPQDAAADSLVVDLTHDAGADETEDDSAPRLKRNERSSDRLSSIGEGAPD